MANVNWITVYTTSAFHCPWCQRAIELLKVYGVDFYIKDIHTNETYRREFIERGHKTVPQVYIEDSLIGGYDKTKVYVRNRYFDKYDEEKRAEILVELDKLD